MIHRFETKIVPAFVLSPLVNWSLLRQSICGVCFFFGCVAVKLSVCSPCGGKKRTERCVPDNTSCRNPLEKANLLSPRICASGAAKNLKSSCKGWGVCPRSAATHAVPVRKRKYQFPLIRSWRDRCLHFLFGLKLELKQEAKKIKTSKIHPRIWKTAPQEINYPINSEEIQTNKQTNKNKPSR